MRFTLQDFVEQGLAESPPELRRAGGAVVRAAQTDDWSRLDRPTRKPASQLPPPEFWLALRRTVPCTLTWAK